MTPNSVRQLAPRRVYSPPAIHRKRIVDAECSCPATRPGVRRMPTPIVPPTLTASPKPTPRTRRSRLDVSDTIATLSVTVIGPQSLTDSILDRSKTWRRQAPANSAPRTLGNLRLEWFRWLQQLPRELPTPTPELTAASPTATPGFSAAPPTATPQFTAAPTARRTPKEERRKKSRTRPETMRKTDPVGELLRSLFPPKPIPRTGSR